MITVAERLPICPAPPSPSPDNSPSPLLTQYDDIPPCPGCFGHSFTCPTSSCVRIPRPGAGTSPASLVSFDRYLDDARPLPFEVLVAARVASLFLSLYLLPRGSGRQVVPDSSFFPALNVKEVFLFITFYSSVALLQDTLLLVNQYLCTTGRMNHRITEVFFTAFSRQLCLNVSLTHSRFYSVNPL